MANRIVKKETVSSLFLLVVLMTAPALTAEQSTAIPLPEHPQPGWERPEWVNLNGDWGFRPDPDNAGLNQGWSGPQTEYPHKIRVPFPWGSPLSGVADTSDIGWYSRTVTIPGEWQGKRVFLVVGASDWKTTGWLDGKELGTHQGGYTTFEFEVTEAARPGAEQTLTLRIDDTPHKFKLEGKQGYGNARGIWQTPYLEARGGEPLRYVHFSPDIDRGVVKVEAKLLAAATRPLSLEIKILDDKVPVSPVEIAAGKDSISHEIKIPEARLWSLEDPYLYGVELSLSGEGLVADTVSSYFGMRKISVAKLPGSGFPYIALNNEPVYLQLALDQSYHPEGFYTFPSDRFVREEILRSKKIGLNGIRVHVKTPLTRKLYWADRLGLLVMSDVPNSWGEPDAEMRGEAETALRGLIERDYNHPSIFSWVIFNETWGLISKDKGYLPETQRWVASMYRLAKQLDPTRLVEDNSANRKDHVETDINSWHSYLPGWAWKKELDQISRDTYPGSQWNFAEGYQQGEQPLYNSECGNVWGYEGSTGDVDWSWDYHLMMDEFRRHPKICGWLYTEHHDVINEWNGYYRFDRSEKYTGLEDFVPGMSLLDLHSPVYISANLPLSQEVAPGSEVEVPLWLSVMSADVPSRLSLKARLFGWDDLGIPQEFSKQDTVIAAEPWMARAIDSVSMKMPSHDALAVLALSVEDELGSVLSRNFTTFVVSRGPAPRVEERQGSQGQIQLIRVAPKDFSDAKWTLKQWDVLEGLKVNGAGAGYFEYRVIWPSGIDPSQVKNAFFRAELSAKQLFGKDREGAVAISGDFMLGKGTHDPSLNKNAYPMTDTLTFPSLVRIRVNGTVVGEVMLPDDPADHRGVLSWHSQLRDRVLREAGSYGYLTTVEIPPDVLVKAAESGSLVIRIEADAGVGGGVAIYGERFGRFLLDPTVALTLD